MLLSRDFEIPHIIAKIFPNYYIFSPRNLLEHPRPLIMPPLLDTCDTPEVHASLRRYLVTSTQNRFAAYDSVT